MQIEPNQTVDEVMRRWPSTIRVFIRFKMHCVGCPIATFHVVTDACREHDVPLPTFLAALEEAVAVSLAEPVDCA
jgi:hybrid cluster-associated redox disulfide protein